MSTNWVVFISLHTYNNNNNKILLFNHSSEVLQYSIDTILYMIVYNEQIGPRLLNYWKIFTSYPIVNIGEIKILDA